MPRHAPSLIARRQRLLLALCGLGAVLGLAGWPRSPLLALAWAAYALAGWWMAVLASQMVLAQRGNRAAWERHQAASARRPPEPALPGTSPEPAAALTPAPAVASAHPAAPATAQDTQPLPPASAAQAWRAWAWSCWAAPQVFFWRQPWREWRWPDRLPAPASPAPPHSTEASKTPAPATEPRAVLFVHGFVSNRGFWNPWLQHLSTRDEPFLAPSLAQPFAGLDAQAAELGAAVDRIVAATGRPPLIVAHSMGGLVVRAWLRREAQAGLPWRQRVHRVALIATPIAGTGLARWALGPLGAQMRRPEDGGHWVAQLNADLDALGLPRTLFACWASTTDNMVFPTHTALLAGAPQQVLPGVPHVPLALHAEVMRAVLALR